MTGDEAPPALFEIGRFLHSHHYYSPLDGDHWVCLRVEAAGPDWVVARTFDGDPWAITDKLLIEEIRSTSIADEHYAECPDRED
jgi:hypothetical protein